MAKQVLVVDDNPKNLKLLKVVLQNAGYGVLEAENGEDGVRVAMEKLPDLVLMDIQMPVMDGIEAMKALKAGQATGAIPVIALTSYAMAGDRERLPPRGLTDISQNPWTSRNSMNR